MKAIGLIENTKSDIKEMLNIVKENNFSYDLLVITIDKISFINQMENKHITFKLFNQLDLIDFLINSNNVNEIFNIDNIYFFQKDYLNKMISNMESII